MFKKRNDKTERLTLFPEDSTAEYVNQTDETMGLNSDVQTKNEQNISTSIITEAKKDAERDQSGDELITKTDNVADANQTVGSNDLELEK